MQRRRTGVSLPFGTYTRLRNHARLLADVGRLAGWFATHGRTSISDGSGIIADFEREFRAMTGSAFALAMTNGTAALHSAYFALGVGPGTEVIVPSYTWHASATPVLQCSAVPVFCDIDPRTLTLSVDDLLNKITARTRAICVVHMWGNPAAMDEIVEVARRHDLGVVEDCSHAHGARYDGRPVGSWGDIGCFSLHASKPVAGGEAGIAVTDDPVLFDRMLLLGHAGRLAAGQAAASFDFSEPVDLGVKYRPHVFAVHLARSQLRRLAGENARRARLWSIVENVLSDARSLAPVQALPKAERGGYYRFVVEYRGDRAGPAGEAADAAEGTGNGPPAEEARARASAQAEAIARLARSRGVPVAVEPYGRNLLHVSPLFSSLDRTQLGGGTFDPTRQWSENTPSGRLPVCEDLAPRLLAFDRLLALASEQFVARATRELRRAAEELTPP